MSDKTGTAQIGVVGMAVMGSNLARNFASKGFKTAIFNRSYSKTEAVLAAHPEAEFVASDNVADFVDSLEKPRRIVMMVKAGSGTDAAMDSLIPYLEAGDIVIDGGNSFFQDTRRREKKMADLGFNAARFNAALIACNPVPHGAENIEFCVALNPGAPGGPLRKIASGGELSRVALAIKKVLARSDALPTLVFDEIDAGIGGKTAEAVAASLRALGNEKQVLLVTHLHQIAKEGSCHFTVTKKVTNDQTNVEINLVEGEKRIEEIARMLGRTDYDGLSFARNLLQHS